MLRSESIEAGYEIFRELRESHEAARARLLDERRRLEQQGQFVLGAVRAARDGSSGTAGPSALARGDGLDDFLSEASRKLEQAKREIDAAAESSTVKWHEALAQVLSELELRVRRQLRLVKPRLKLRVRALADDRRILHVDRPSADEAVLLCFLFTAKLPSRYGYLFDEWTDDVRQAPPMLYAEEGVLPTQVRPDPRALELLLDEPRRVVPLKGMLPLRLPTLLRFVERGPVMEAEIADGAAFRNVLTREEAERVAGQLLKLKLEGAVELELLAE